MQEVNVTVYEHESLWYGKNQADNTVIFTYGHKIILLLIIRKMMEDAGDKCNLNFYDKEGKHIKSYKIKSRKSKYFLKYGDSRNKEIPTHLKHDEHTIKYKRKKQ